MALTLVATAGANNANTYITLTDAETVMLEYLSHITSGWTAASDSNKNIALVQATRDIDNLRLSGEKYNEGYDENNALYQPLHFPTTEDVNDSGALYIPAAVERATVLQAAWLLKNGTDMQAALEIVNRGIKSHSIGHYSASYSGSSIVKVCPECKAELKRWLITSIRIERG